MVVSKFYMQKKWRDAYADLKHRKMLFPNAPSGSGKFLLSYLRDNNFESNLKVLDLGCGNGRNAFSLAKMGLRVVGLDGIESAVIDAQEQAQREGFVDTLEFVVCDLGLAPWPVNSVSFDVAIDINTFSSLLGHERAVYIDELYRVLRKDALFFLYTYTQNDEYYAQFITPTPPHQRIGLRIHCPDDHVDRILYSVEELKQIFSPWFKVVGEKVFIRYSKMFDVYYKRHFCALILKKYDQ